MRAFHNMGAPFFPLGTGLSISTTVPTDELMKQQP